MFSIRRFFMNSNLILLAAMVLGLVAGDCAHLFKAWILPALLLIMSLSTTQVTLGNFTQVRLYLRDMAIVFVINYLFLSGLILLASHLLIQDHDLHVGFVIMAAIPSAVAVLPFTYLLKGEMMVSLLGSVGLYLGALGMAPLISLVFLDVAGMGLSRLISTLLQLIVVPFVVSRLLLKWNHFHRMREMTGITINMALFLTIYTVMGINRSTFLSHFDILIPLCFIAFLRTFISGHLVDLVARLLGVGRDRRMSYVLFGSFKNLAVVVAITLFLFDERSAIPATVAIPFEITFFIWFNFFQKRWGQWCTTQLSLHSK
jgi:BASS family bile acid:Na+ symporter